MQHSPSAYNGLAAEHLVCADLLLNGIVASLQQFASSQFDILADLGAGGFVRIQVKSTERPCLKRGFRGDGRRRDRFRERPVYRFILRQRYALGEIDMFAFVALDRRQIVYETAARCCGVSMRQFAPSTFEQEVPGSLQRALIEIAF